MQIMFAQYLANHNNKLAKKHTEFSKKVQNFTK